MCLLRPHTIVPHPDRLPDLVEQLKLVSPWSPRHPCNALEQLMRSRDASMLNTRAYWTTPWMKVTPVGASSNSSFVHMHASHGMTLPVSPLRHAPHLPLPQVAAAELLAPVKGRCAAA